LDEHLENLGVQVYTRQEDLVRETATLDEIERSMKSREDELLELQNQLTVAENELASKIVLREDKERTVNILREELDVLTADIRSSIAMHEHLVHESKVSATIRSRTNELNREIQLEQNRADLQAFRIEKEIASIEDEIAYLSSDIDHKMEKVSDIQDSVSEALLYLSRLIDRQSQLNHRINAMDTSIARRADTVTEMMKTLTESIPVRIEREAERRRIIRDLKKNQAEFYTKLVAFVMRTEKKRQRCITNRDLTMIAISDLEKESKNLQICITQSDSQISSISASIKAAQSTITKLDQTYQKLVSETSAILAQSLVLISSKKLLTSTMQDRIKEYKDFARYENSREDEMLRVTIELDRLVEENSLVVSHIEALRDELEEVESRFEELKNEIFCVEKSISVSNRSVEKKREIFRKLDSLLLEKQRKRDELMSLEKSSEYSLSLRGKVETAERNLELSFVEIEKTKNQWLNTINEIGTTNRTISQITESRDSVQVRLSVFSKKFARKRLELEETREKINSVQKIVSSNSQVYNKLIGLMMTVNRKIDSLSTQLQLVQQCPGPGAYDAEQAGEKLSSQKFEIKSEIAEIVTKIASTTKERTELEREIRVKSELANVKTSPVVLENNKNLTSTVRQLEIRLKSIQSEKLKIHRTIIKSIQHPHKRKVSLASRSTRPTMSTLAPSLDLPSSTQIVWSAELHRVLNDIKGGEADRVTIKCGVLMADVEDRMAVIVEGGKYFEEDEHIRELKALGEVIRRLVQSN
jgi:chromosome segregation ATPase